jgi:cysteine desulfurase
LIEAYLDNNSTTQLLPIVRERFVGALDSAFANPSSKHRPGQRSRRLLEAARGTVASHIGARYASEILFTSSATEATFQALRSGSVRASQILVGAADHSAVHAAAAASGSGGLSVVTIPVLANGTLEMSALEPLISSKTTLVSITLANNETGVIAETEAVAALCRRHGALLHMDAAQAFGRIDVDVGRLGCDYLTLSPHKFHGPKGVGILYVRRGAPCTPIFAGHQEFGLRGGTENIAAIAGAAASVEANADWQEHQARIARLRDKLERGVLDAIPGATVNGAGAPRVANTTSIYFPSRNAADLVAALSRRGVHASAASACTADDAPSHVLLAMGFDRQRASGSIRFSLSRLTREEEIDNAIEQTRAVHEATLSFHG